MKNQVFKLTERMKISLRNYVVIKKFSLTLRKYLDPGEDLAQKKRYHTADWKEKLITEVIEILLDKTAHTKT